MALIDKLHALADADPNTNLLELFGVRPDQFRWDRERLTVGAESLPMEQVRAAIAGGPIPQTPEPRRTVFIADLELGEGTHNGHGHGKDGN